MSRFFLWFMAFFRLSDKAICEMSKERGPHDDYHDYHDAGPDYYYHFVRLKCQRCGKDFYI